LVYVVRQRHGGRAPGSTSRCGSGVFVCSFGISSESNLRYVSAHREDRWVDASRVVFSHVETNCTCESGDGWAARWTQLGLLVLLWPGRFFWQSAGLDGTTLVMALDPPFVVSRRADCQMSRPAHRNMIAVDRAFGACRRQRSHSTVRANAARAGGPKLQTEPWANPMAFSAPHRPRPARIWS